MPFAVVVAFLLTSTALAGCFGRDESSRPDGNGSPANPGAASGADSKNGTEEIFLPFSEISKCSFWTYPDGSPAHCENEATRLGTEAQEPPNWLCLHEWVHEEGDVTLQRDLLGNEFGLAYDAEAGPLQGVMSIRSGEQALFYNWSGPASGFVRLPEPLGSNLSIFLIVYRSWYETNISGFEGGAVEDLWALFDDRPWAIHRITVGERVHFVQLLEGSFDGGSGGIFDEGVYMVFHDNLVAEYVPDIATTVPKPDC